MDSLQVFGRHYSQIGVQIKDRSAEFGSTAKPTELKPFHLKNHN